MHKNTYMQKQESSTQPPNRNTDTHNDKDTIFIKDKGLSNLWRDREREATTLKYRIFSCFHHISYVIEAIRETGSIGN